MYLVAAYDADLGVCNLSTALKAMFDSENNYNNNG